MLKFTSILLALLYGIGVYYISAWRTRGELNKKSKPLNDREITALTQKMAAVLDLPHIKVHIYEIEPINGLASPDGRIFITRGFLKKYNMGDITSPEIASVIAHELGHVALGHTRKRVISFSGQNAIRVALGMFFARFLGGFGHVIANIIAQALASKLSRNDEYKADAYAAALLTKSGIGTTAQKTLLAKLDSLADGRRSPLAWMMSHPSTPDRIAAIECLEKKWADLD